MTSHGEDPQHLEVVVIVTAQEDDIDGKPHSEGVYATSRTQPQGPVDPVTTQQPPAPGPAGSGHLDAAQNFALAHQPGHGASLTR